ncbi:MAG: J domain-containing protein [Acidobacteria bacterium]|nr:J domain-containing protein [Acidobacteriota bacterium]MYG75765.1 J domain-containing protein [Acidobacteriota bacterium]
MKYRDYYAVLGVRKQADAQAIKQAYRRLARKHHPDLNPGDHQAVERFKEIGEAYEVLSDPDRRRRYDQLGPDWARQVRSSRPGTAGGPQPDPRAFGDFSSFFLHLFGPDSPFGPLEGRTRRAPGWPPSARCRSPGPPADAPGRTGVVEISLEEAYQGALRQLHTSRTDSYRVRIPPGVRDGARLKVRTPDGDAMLAVRVANHPRFRREGDNLEVEVPVRFAEAALGGEIEVPTLGDPVRIRIPAGISGGAALRVPGRGMPRPGGGHGDLVVRVRIAVPRDLTPEQKDFVRRFEASEASSDESG